MEQADVVIVGARCAGTAAAAPLARAGRRVVVLDRMRFPSDQLSTHVLQPNGTSELAKLGALPRILALNPSLVRWVRLEAEGAVCLERLRPADDGIDFGVCIPRDLQDVQLVEAAREQGADIREGCTVDELLWRAGRVAGVRYRDADGERREIAATLVIGADGRRSTVSSLVGSWTPYRMSRNGRGLVFRYLDDPRAGTAMRRRSASGARATRSRSRSRRPRPGGSSSSSWATATRCARRDRTPRATGRASCASTPASPTGSPAPRPARSCARPVRRPRSSARRRGRAGRSPGTPATSRTRSPARGCATRSGPGGRSPRGSCRPSTTRSRSTRRRGRGRRGATASACPPTTSRTRTRASSASPHGLRARPRRGPHDGRRPQRPLRARAYAAADRAAPAARPRDRRGAAARRALAPGDARARRRRPAHGARDHRRDAGRPLPQRPAGDGLRPPRRGVARTARRAPEHRARRRRRAAPVAS